MILAALSLFSFGGINPNSGDFIVTDKSNEYGYFVIGAETNDGERCRTTYSGGFYAKTSLGDQLHRGFRYLIVDYAILRREGKLVAVELPPDTILYVVWVAVAFATMAAYLPESKMPEFLLPFIGIAEVLTFAIPAFFLLLGA